MFNKKQFTILIDGISIGFFDEEKHRNEAFDTYVLPNSENCFKGVRE